MWCGNGGRPHLHHDVGSHLQANVDASHGVPLDLALLRKDRQGALCEWEMEMGNGSRGNNPLKRN